MQEVMLDWSWSREKRKAITTFFPIGKSSYVIRRHFHTSDFTFQRFAILSHLRANVSMQIYDWPGWTGLLPFEEWTKSLIAFSHCFWNHVELSDRCADTDSVHQNPDSSATQSPLETWGPSSIRGEGSPAVPHYSSFVSPPLTTPRLFLKLPPFSILSEIKLWQSVLTFIIRTTKSGRVRHGQLWCPSHAHPFYYFPQLCAVPLAPCTAIPSTTGFSISRTIWFCSPRVLNAISSI